MCNRRIELGGGLIDKRVHKIEKIDYERRKVGVLKIALHKP